MNKLKAMQVFISVAETGSFSGAAEDLNIGQASVSKYIAALEANLHCQLILRSTRQIKLTPAGKRYFQYASRLIQDLAVFENNLDSRGAQTTGMITMTAPDPFASRVIIPLLPQFYARYPEIQINMILGERQFNLIKEGFDLAVRSKRKFEDSALISQHLCDMPSWLVASPEYLSRYSEIKTPEMLEKHNFLSYRNGQTTGKLRLRNAKRSTSINVSGNFICNKGEVLLSAVVSGLGIAELPYWMVNEEISAGRLVRVLPDYSIPDLPFKIVYPRRDNQPERVKRLIAFLKENITTADS